MGPVVSENSSPQGNWSSNILPNGQTVPPGNYVFFNIDIPPQHYCDFRLGVKNENDNEIMLHEQQSYTDDHLLGSIKHWGSNERSVEVTVLRNQTDGLIVISGYSDFAGLNN